MRYQNGRIACTTIHQKERFLGRACHKILGASLISSGDKINTDLLGTFSGEVERKQGPEETVRMKCLQGMECLGLDLGVATEGSFGPHPLIPFIPFHQEMIVFIDQQIGLTVFEKIVSVHTNYQRHVYHRDEHELTEIIQSTKFPSHGLMIKPVGEDKGFMFKGVQELSLLKKALDVCASYSDDGSVVIETDMRAHMNPTRGYQIKKLGIRLFRRLSSLCPECSAPGFGRVGYQRGLPCEVCLCPTQLVISQIFSCQLCHYSEQKPIRSGILCAEPKYCSYCNP